MEGWEKEKKSLWYITINAIRTSTLLPIITHNKPLSPTWFMAVLSILHGPLTMMICCVRLKPQLVRERERSDLEDKL